MEALISEIKAMLNAGHGRDLMITPSAYDTAWIARVPTIDGSARPQFPRTVKRWLMGNSLSFSAL